MNKEPIGLYIFRFVLGLGLFAFMAMLYWSSVLVEAELKFLRSDISQLKTDIFSLRSDIDKIRDDIIKFFVEKSDEPKKNSLHQQTINQLDLASQASFSNLLVEDPFYKITLPKLLGKDFKPHGKRREATIGDPHNLHPFSNWSQVASWTNLCTVSISSQQFGKYETFSPDMALRMELKEDKNGVPEYWLYLRPNIFWLPLQPEHFVDDIKLAPHFLRKHPVTAHDFKFYIDAILNPHVEEAQAVALRLYYSDIREIEVIDDYTFVVRWKTTEVKGENGEISHKMRFLAKTWTGALKPLASFVYQYFPDGTKIIPDDSDPNTYRTNPVWAQNFSHHWAKNVIVSCGPWLFDGITDREIRFKRNSDYYEPNAVLVDALEIKIKDSPDTVWEDFKSGVLDTFQVPPNQLAELDRFLQSEAYQEQEKRGLGIKRLNFITRSYSYIGWNQAKPWFKSRKVRQALTMAIDRQRIIEHYLNGMGIEITGTFFRFSPSYDPSIPPLPFDLNKSRQLLAEEGWYDSTGTGVIDKMIDGQRVPFQFTLTYYIKNPLTKSICEYIATTLREVGIKCHPNGVDIADLSATFDDKNFDAIFLGWSLGAPPEDPKQLWYSTGAKEKGSSNAIGFANKDIDAIIDQLEFEYDPQKRIELYHRFDKILYEEAPYTFLYTPKVAMVYRNYLQNVFIPAERQDLIPGANVAEPEPSIFWIKESFSN